MTNEQVPVQTALNWVDGTPEGRDYAPPGYVVIEKTFGTWYRKTTSIESNTGWEAFSSSAGGSNFFTNLSLAGGSPPIDGSVLTQGVWDLDTNVKFYNAAWPVTATPDWRAM